MIDILRVVLDPAWLKDKTRLTVFSGFGKFILDCNPDKLIYDIDVADYDHVGVQVNSLEATIVYADSFKSDRIKNTMFTVAPFVRIEDRNYPNA